MLGWLLERPHALRVAVAPGLSSMAPPAGSEISGCTIQNAQYGVSVISSNSFYTQWCTIQNSTTGVYSSGGDVAN